MLIKRAVFFFIWFCTIKLYALIFILNPVKVRSTELILVCNLLTCSGISFLCKTYVEYQSLKIVVRVSLGIIQLLKILKNSLHFMIYRILYFWKLYGRLKLFKNDVILMEKAEAFKNFFK